MSASKESIVSLLKEAGKAHHEAFIEVNGADDEWPIWYAEYLIDKLPPLLDGMTAITKSELVYLLILLDKKVKEDSPEEPWQAYYADYFLEEYG